MKALNDMNNVEKAYLLAKLFPERLKELVAFQMEEIQLQQEQESYIRSQWTDSMITADFWFGLIANTAKIIDNQKTALFKSQRVYSYHLFDGYNALFSMHCLITYAAQEDCPLQLKQIIHLLFGEQRIFNLELDRR